MGRKKLPDEFAEGTRVKVTEVYETDAYRASKGYVVNQVGTVVNRPLRKWIKVKNYDSPVDNTYHGDVKFDDYTRTFHSIMVKEVKE